MKITEKENRYYLFVKLHLKIRCIWATSDQV